MLQNIFQQSTNIRHFWILTQAALVLLDPQKFVSAAVWYHWLSVTSSSGQLPGSEVETGRRNTHTHTELTEFNKIFFSSAPPPPSF
jgi:hypothetical protein